MSVTNVVSDPAALPRSAMKEYELIQSSSDDIPQQGVIRQVFLIWSSHDLLQDYSQVLCESG